MLTKQPASSMLKQLITKVSTQSLERRCNIVRKNYIMPTLYSLSIPEWAVVYTLWQSFLLERHSSHAFSDKNSSSTEILYAAKGFTFNEE